MEVAGRAAALFLASPSQVNFVVPESAPVGRATLRIAGGMAGDIIVSETAPGLFAATGSGRGPALAAAMRVAADGSVANFPVFLCSAPGACNTMALDFGGGDLYLTLYGTGIKNRGSLGAVSCRIGGQSADVLYAGEQGLPALDQVNVRVPRSLQGAGEVDLVVTVEGVTSNAVRVAFR
jgi:uncharacterized protein (TIGR03437 family)